MENAILDIQNVSVRFANGSAVQAVEQVSLSVFPSDKLCIIGETGSGKSTIALLLARLYDPKEGSITIGGVDLKEMDQTALRRGVGVVLPEPFLFSRTVAQNIAITKDGVSQAEIEQAAKEACLHDSISSFQDGYDTVVGERGVTLSGGEPLFQPDFALEILREAKDRGISTAIETSGFGDPEKLRACAEYIDVFLFDYKATGDEMHKEFCGVPQSPILKNLSLLDEIGANVVLRCPIITGKNDIPEHIAGIAATAKAHSSIHLIQLEPYHKLGISKSDKLGEDVLYDGAVPARAALEAYCAEISAASGKECTIS